MPYATCPNTTAAKSEHVLSKRKVVSFYFHRNLPQCSFSSRNVVDLLWEQTLGSIPPNCSYLLGSHGDVRHRHSIIGSSSGCRASVCHIWNCDVKWAVCWIEPITDQSNSGPFSGRKKRYFDQLRCMYVLIF